MTDKDNLLIKTKKTVLGIVTITTMFSLSYAILRYNIFGSVPWKDLPFYVMNKAISLTAIIMYTISYGLKFLNKSRVKVSQKWLDAGMTIGITSFFLILIHVLMSLMLFKPEIFAKFFEENGMISSFGGLSMIAGIISFSLLFGINLNASSNIKIIKTSISLPKVLNVAMLFIIIHLFFMGYNGWITPAKWHGGMPPISLIAFLFSSFGILLNLISTLDSKALNKWKK